ncbi:MAG: 1-acyl-sn-glycerol-3-phosphate acyltransferase [Muribaculaceae bacterium]|nr:1-acyl-sn-glycerol-3-phosphate acyltransferase [Muribaculaceae bacterium]
MLFFYRIYQWCIAYPILVVITAITALVTIVMTSLCGNHFWGYYPAHIWSRCVCALLFVKVVVRGRDNIDPHTSYVFVANHQGAFDIWSIYGYLNHDFKWLMKKELEKIILVGKACRRAGHVMVDDSSVTGIRTTIQESEKTLQGGMSLVIFPEGSRTFDGRMIPFKRGAFMLAAEYRLPVVPITIDGAFRRMPRTTYNTTPGRITLTIHPPIFPDEKGFNTKRLMAQCYDEIESALPESDRTPRS